MSVKEVVHCGLVFKRNDGVVKEGVCYLCSLPWCEDYMEPCVTNVCFWCGEYLGHTFFNRDYIEEPEKFVEYLKACVLERIDSARREQGSEVYRKNYHGTLLYDRAKKRYENNGTVVVDTIELSRNIFSKCNKHWNLGINYL